MPEDKNDTSLEYTSLSDTPFYSRIDVHLNDIIGKQLSEIKRIVERLDKKMKNVPYLKNGIWGY